MKIVPFLILFLLPTSFLRAQTLNHVLEMMTDVVVRAVPVGILVALAVFVWGIVQMIGGLKIGKSDKAVSEGKNKMVWGIVGLFFIVSVWGIVEIVRVTFIPNRLYYPVQEVPFIDWAE